MIKRLIWILLLAICLGFTIQFNIYYSIIMLFVFWINYNVLKIKKAITEFIKKYGELNVKNKG